MIAIQCDRGLEYDVFDIFALRSIRKDQTLMSVTALKHETSSTAGEAPFRAAMNDLTANELIFAVVGPGSGTSEIAEALARRSAEIRLRRDNFEGADGH